MNLQNFLPLVLFIVAVLGDKTLEVLSKDLFRGLVDSSCHGIIGLISWLIIALKSYKFKISLINPYCDVILSWFISSAIDIDHFLLAKSFKLKDALHLGQQRPLLHCSSIPLVFLLISNVSNWLWRLPRFAYFGWIVWVAIISHHVRDGYRRGLWFWPFGSTAPIPYILYILITMTLPHATFMMMLKLEIFNPYLTYSNITIV